MTLRCKLFLPGLLFIFTLPFLLQTAPASADSLYTANNNGSISVINTSIDSLTDTISLPFSSKPTAICLNAVSPHAYTLNSGDNTVSIIDTKNKTLISTIADTRFTGLTALACDPTGTRVLIGNNDASGTTSSILYLNTETLVLESQETAVGNNPGSIVFNKNGSKAYVLNQGTPSISVIDTSTKLVDSTTQLLDSNAPYALAMHTLDTYLYVVNALGNAVTFINPATMEIDPSPPLITGLFSTVLAVSNATDILYVSDSNNTIFLVNPILKSVTTYSIESPLALVERNDGQRIYVATYDNIIRSYDTASLSSAPTTIPLPPFSSPQGLATLQGMRHNLDLIVTGNGSGSVNWPFNVTFPQNTGGTAGVPEGIAVTINSTADSCSTVAWNACDSTSGGGSNSAYCTVNPFTIDKAVNAVFTKKSEHTITTSVSGVGGAITCPNSVCDGGNVICSIAPATGYELTSLKDNGSDILGSVTGGTAVQIQNVLGAHSIEAGFTLRRFTVTASSDLNGSITPSSQTVSYENTANFTLTPNSGFSLVAVSGCDGTLNGSIYTTGPITGDCTVSAAFTPGFFTVTSQIPNGGGSISCLPSAVLSGENSICTINPNAGFHLETLNDSGSDKTSSIIGTSYQIANITSSHDVVALFINSPPIANSQTVSTPENQVLSIILAGSDAEGSALSYNVITSPTHGLLSGTAPNVTYTPTTGYVGIDSFTFTVGDEVNTSAPASVNISVTQVTKTLKFYSGSGGAITGITQQDINLYIGTAAAVTAEADPGYHFVNWSDSSGFMTSTANPLTVTNVTADMDITANFINSPPTANGQNVSTPQNQTLNITLNASDPELSIVAYAITDYPIHGILSGTAPNFTYTPTADFVGGDSFTFTVSDGTNTSSPATVNINVTQVVKTVNFFVSIGGTIIGPTTQPINLHGSTLAATASPDPGYQFVNWTGTNGFATTTINPLTLSDVTTDTDITANFSHDPVDGVCGADNGLTLAALTPTVLCLSGSASVVSGSGHPWEWSCNGQYGGTTPPLLCSATIKQYNVSFTAPENGTIIDITSQTIDHGASTTAVTASTGSTGFHFDNWTGTGLSTTSSNPLTVNNVTSDLVITANFSQDPVIGNCGDDNGLVLAAITPTNLCSYGSASVVTGSGHPWDWSCDGQYEGTTATCSATRKQYNVTFAPPTNGSISDGTTQSIDYGASTLAVTATANPGYHFHNWTSTGGVVISNVSTLTLTNITADLYVTANFSINPVNGACGTDNGQVLAAMAPTNLCSSGSSSAVTGNGDPSWVWSCNGQYGGSSQSCSAAIKQFNIAFPTPANGTVIDNATQILNYGSSTMAVTASANPGYHFVNWTDGSGLVVSAANPLILANINADMIVTANLVNSVPAANGQSLTTLQDQALGIVLTASDPERSALTYSTQIPVHGTITGIAPNLIYTPATGYAGTDSFTFTVNDGMNTSATATINISITQVSRTVSFAAGNNGAITGISPQIIDLNGSTTPVTAVANPGYHFFNWTGTNGFVTTMTNPLTVTNITSNMSITANFNLYTYSTTTSTPGGNGSVSCTTIADYGTSVSCTIVPANGYKLAGLIDNGADVLASVNTNSYTISNITANHSLAATFALSSYTVAVNYGPNGSATPSTAQTITHGNPASFTFTPDTGYHVVIPVGGTCSGSLSGTTYTTLPITSACNVAAVFTPNRYSITAAVGNGGNIVPATSNVEYGSTSIFFITPDSGYYIGSVHGCGGTLSGNDYTTGSVIGDCSISATFVALPTVSASTLISSGSISCSNPAFVGDTATCMITPDKGYHLGTLTDNGVSVLPLVANKDTYTLNNIASSHNIAAAFTAYSLSDALQALRYAVRIELPKPDEHLWLDVAPLDSGKPKGNGVIDIMDALVLLKHSIGSYTAW